jgi:hypothetical protein
MTHRKRVAVLGSTGSIGVSTLDVLALHPGQFEVFALTAATRVDALLAQCVQFRPTYAVMTSPAHGADLARRCADAGLPTRVLCGPDALGTVAGDERVDIVMAAIVGAAGLASCMTAALAGKRLLLANKEALVVGGEVFMAAVRKGGAKLLHAFGEATVPRVTLVTRKIYGGAYIAMNSRSLGATKVFAWPDAEVAVMGAKAAVGILHKRKLAAAPDDEREALHTELAAEHERIAGGVDAAIEIGVVDEKIDPAHTRSKLTQTLAEAPNRRGRHKNIPL